MNKENNEAQVILAFQALKRDPTLSLRKVASTYFVFLSMLFYRKRGRISKRDCTSKSRKLTNIEEKAIIQRMLELDLQGFSPRISIVEDMAN